MLSNHNDALATDDRDPIGKYCGWPVVKFQLR